MLNRSKGTLTLCVIQTTKSEDTRFEGSAKSSSLARARVRVFFSLCCISPKSACHSSKTLLRFGIFGGTQEAASICFFKTTMVIVCMQNSKRKAFD